MGEQHAASGTTLGTLDFNGGRFDFDDGGTYCGGWEDGKAHGHGVCTGPKGQGEFAGSWHYGFEVSGVYTWPSGSTYEGHWQNGKRHGLGVEARGRWLYRGEWTQGFKGRYGVRQSTLSGAKYEGTWANGLQDGYGSETYADQGTYQGQWLRGMRHGYGVRTSAPYGVASLGPTGLEDMRGSETSLNKPPGGDNSTHQGPKRSNDSEIRGGFVLRTRSDEVPHRRRSLVERSGMKTFVQGIKLKKQRSTGDLDRKGVSGIRSAGSTTSWMSSESGYTGAASVMSYGSNQSFNLEEEHLDPSVTETYMGEWKNDKRAGFGISERSDGLKYEGEWYNNRKYGYGVTTFRDGKKEEGKYKNNILITSNQRRHLFLIRSAKFRERIDSALNAAQRAGKIALQKADIANSRTATARGKAEQADIAAIHAKEDSQHALECADQYQDEIDKANPSDMNPKPSFNEIGPPKVQSFGNPPSRMGNSTFSKPSTSSASMSFNEKNPSAFGQNPNAPSTPNTTSMTNNNPPQFRNPPQPTTPQPQAQPVKPSFSKPHVTVQLPEDDYGRQGRPSMGAKASTASPLASMGMGGSDEAHPPPGGFRRPPPSNSMEQASAEKSKPLSTSLSHKPSFGFDLASDSKPNHFNTKSAKSSILDPANAIFPAPSSGHSGAAPTTPTTNCDIPSSSRREGPPPNPAYSQRPSSTSQPPQKKIIDSIEPRYVQHNSKESMGGGGGGSSRQTAHHSSRHPTRTGGGSSGPSGTDYNFHRIMEDRLDQYRRPPSRPPSREASIDRLPQTLAEARHGSRVNSRPASRTKMSGHQPGPEGQPLNGDLNRTNPGSRDSSVHLRYRGPSQEIHPTGAIPKRTESLYMKASDEDNKNKDPSMQLQRKKSLPDVQDIVQVTSSQGSREMTREEISALSSSRREAVRRNMEESAKYENNPLMYIIGPRVQEWFRRQQVMLLVLFVNLSLAFMFFKLLT